MLYSKLSLSANYLRRTAKSLYGSSNLKDIFKKWIVEDTKLYGHGGKGGLFDFKKEDLSKFISEMNPIIEKAGKDFPEESKVIKDSCKDLAEQVHEKLLSYVAYYEQASHSTNEQLDDYVNDKVSGIKKLVDEMQSREKWIKLAESELKGTK